MPSQKNKSYAKNINYLVFTRVFKYNINAQILIDLGDYNSALYQL